jgi:hypothetical protein
MVCRVLAAPEQRFAAVLSGDAATLEKCVTEIRVSKRTVSHKLTRQRIKPSLINKLHRFCLEDER